MKKTILLSLLLVFIASATLAQTTSIILNKEKDGEFETQIFLLENEDIDQQIDALQLPKKVEKEIKEDIQKNYKPGEKYRFNTEEGNTMFTLEIDNDTDIAVSDNDKEDGIPLFNKKFNAPLFKADVSQAYLGIQYDVYDYKTDKNRKNLRGVLVKDIVKGEAAYNAGIEKGDVITKINDKTTPSISLFKDAIAELRPRQEVTFTINRNGKAMTLKSIAGKRIDESRLQLQGENIFPFYFEEIIPNDIKEKLDLKKLEEMDREELKEWKDRNFDFEQFFPNKAQLGVIIEDTDEGVLVKRVEEGTAAKEAGIKCGDIIIKVDGKKVSSAKELSKQIREKEINESVKIQVLRNGKKKNLNAKLKKSKNRIHIFREKG